MCNNSLNLKFLITIYPISVIRHFHKLVYIRLTNYNDFQ